MIDFAIKLPRVASAALAFADAKGDVTAESKALLDAAIEDIPKLGWDAPFSLLSLIERIRSTREKAGPESIHFDTNGNGPLCAHGEFPCMCSLCSAASEAELALRSTLVRLARAS